MLLWHPRRLGILSTPYTAAAGKKYVRMHLPRKDMVSSHNERPGSNEINRPAVTASYGILSLAAHAIGMTVYTRLRCALRPGAIYS